MRAKGASRRLGWMVFALLANACEPHASAAGTGAAPRRAAPAPARQPAMNPGPGGAATTEPVPEPAAGVHYVERVTAGAPREARLPLIVAIHGLGDAPERFVAFFEALDVRARVIAPRGLTPYDGGYSWFDVPVRGDPAALAVGVRRAADALTVAVRQIAQTRPTCGRPIVLGFSQGGILSFALAAQAPMLASAVFPVSGLLPPGLWPRDAPAGAAPVFALHGTADARVPFDGARRTLTAFQTAGYRAELREFPGVGHTISPAMATELAGRLAAAVGEQSAGCR